MRRTRGWLLTGIALLAGCDRSPVVTGTVNSTVRFVMPPGALTVRCDSSTVGRCYVRVEDRGRTHAGWLPVGKSRRFSGVSPAARTCVLAIANAVCTWTPVLRTPRT